MSRIGILFHSGYGHTRVQAEAVLAGINKLSGVEAQMVEVSEQGELTEAQWQWLAEATGIIFGSPTYMGTVSWQFKKVADASSQVWANQGWKDKLAAGFTNSATVNGDKAITIQYLQAFAAQHSMLWVSTGMMPANQKESDRNDLNYLGGFSGLLAQSPSNASPAEGPLPGDLATAEVFGERFATLVRQQG